MKTTKRITAILLCLVLILGTTFIGASAYEIGDEVAWQFPGSFATENPMYYGGKFVDGNNLMTADESGFYAYEFTAEKTGYYEFKITDYIMYGLSESYDGVTPSGERNFILLNMLSYNGRLYYLTQGTHMLYFYVSEKVPTVLSASYVAESIGKIEFYDDRTKNLLVGYDVDIHEEDNTVTFSDFGGEITMSNGDVYEFAYSPDCKLKENFKNGENTVILEFPGYSTETVITAYTLDYYIESVELVTFSKGEATDYFNTESRCRYHYDGYHRSTLLANEGVKINFTDNVPDYQVVHTVLFREAIENGEPVRLPDGNDYQVNVFCYYDNELETDVIEVSIADHSVYKTACTVVNELSYKQHLKIYFDKISDYLYESRGRFNYQIRRIVASDSIEMAIGRINDMTSDIFLLFSRIFNESALFLRYF